MTLTPYLGTGRIDEDGTVIDGKDVTTCLLITANNVTIRNSRVSCASPSPSQGGTMLIQQTTAQMPTVRGLTIINTEISRPDGATGGADYGVMIYGQDVVLSGVYIHNVTSGVHLGGTGVLIQDSFIGGLVDISGQDHVDGIISNGGVTDVTLSHNTIEVPGPQVTPLAIFPEHSPNSRWVIDDNLLAGGAFCIYPSYSKGKESPNYNITVTNNVFGRHLYPTCGANGPAAGGRGGAAFLDGTGNVWSGNVWSDTKDTVSAP